DFRYPFHHLRIRGRLPLRHHLLDELDRALDLLRRHVLDRIAMLDLMLARHQQSEDLEIRRRLRPAHLRNRLLPMHGEIPQQRANHRLAQLVTRATQSSGRVALDENLKLKSPPYRGVKGAALTRAPPICLSRGGDACVLGAVERVGNTLYGARVYVELGGRLAHAHAVRQSHLDSLSQLIRDRRPAKALTFTLGSL